MQRMFGMVRELLTLSSSSNGKKKDNQAGEFNKLYTRIEKYEGISDNMELEIANYLNSVSDAHLSDETKAKIRAMLREVSELESIGDACFNMARKYNGKQDHFIEKQYDHLHQMMELTDQSLSQMNRLMGGRKAELDLALVLGKRIQLLGSTLRSRDDQFKADLLSDLGQQVWPMFAEGRLSPQLAKTFPIEQAHEAFEELASNQVSGKLVLVIDPTLV